MSGLLEQGFASPQLERSEPLHDKRLLIRQCTLILGVAIGLGAGFSGLYFGTLSIFLKPMAADFEWTRAEIASLSSLAMLGYAIAAPLQGLLIDRIGARRLIGCSIPLFAALILSLSFLPGQYAVFAVVSVLIGLLGVGTGPAGYMTVLPRVFDQRLGLALSFSMVGAGIGAASLPLVAQHLLATFGWRQAYQGLALIAFSAGILAFLLMRFGPLGSERARAKADAKGSAAASAATSIDETSFGASFGEAVRGRRFWTLIFAIFFSTAGGLGATVHITALFNDQGIAPERAVQIGAFTGIGLMCGRFLAGFLMDVFFAPLVVAAGFVLGAIGLIVIGLDPTGAFPLLAFCTLLFGFALGAEGDFAAFAVRRYFGTKAFGAIYGAIFTAYALGGIVGPTVFGIAYDRLGNYTFVMFVAAAGFIVSTLAVLTLGAYRWARQ